MELVNYRRLRERHLVAVQITGSSSSEEESGDDIE
jgi:hypothetical protein